MEAGMPNARLRVLPSAGHLPNLEQPVLFNQEVSRFLVNF
jgi:pimeloyl-ACP methyl ester carboxylesterase